MDRQELFYKRNVKSQIVESPVLVRGENFFPYTRNLNGKRIVGYRVLSNADYDPNKGNKAPTPGELASCTITFVNDDGDLILDNVPANSATIASNGGQIMRSNMFIDLPQCTVTVTAALTNKFIPLELYYIERESN